MKKCLIVLSIIFCCKMQSIGQTLYKPKQNALSFELGKTGVIYNLTFDHKLSDKNFGFRLIAGSNLGSYITFNNFGVGGYYLAGGSSNFFEAGLDIQYLLVKEHSDDQRGFAEIFIYPDYPIEAFYTSLNLGYRRYGKQTLFRMGASPGLIRSKFVPGGYISFGISF